MSNLAYLLLNVLFIALPFLLLQTFSQRASFLKTGSLHIAVFTVLPLIGCMAFPMLTAPDYVLDLNLIPLIVGTLYGGLRAGLALTAAAGLARWLLIGGDALLATTVCLIVAAVVASVRDRIVASDWKRKLLWGAALSLLAAGVQYAGFALHEHLGSWKEQAIFFLLQTGLLLFALAFSEHIRETVSVRKERMRMEKLTANSSLAVIIAHELRNPLTTVNGFLQLIKRQQPSEQITYYANMAIQELNEAEKVIHTYLTITMMQEADKSDVSLSNCIDAALQQLWPAIERKSIDLVNAVSEDVLLHCNEEQLQLCLLHLLRNGVNALHRGGKLTVSSFWRGKELAIVVSDNGIGMTEEQLEQLGMPKYNTRSSGTGTGLMYCYHFVHSMQGRLRIQSQPGRGTIVTVTLPGIRSG